MYFKHPEILYALFALIIPVIIHLFQLQKFEKVPFTNVKMLLQIEKESRKSSTLKKWLILITRLFLLSALILAFSGPFLPSDSSKKDKETIIYLDNSLSMQAKGNNGALMQSAVKYLIETQSGRSLKLITNDKKYNHIGHELTNLNYTPLKKSIEQIFLQTGSASSENKKNQGKNILLISDFQQPITNMPADSLNNYYFIQLKPVKTANIYIDTITIAKKDRKDYILRAAIVNFGAPDQNVAVSLYINGKLEGKTSVDLQNNKTVDVDFSVNNDHGISGKIIINTDDLLFDNTRFFSFNNSGKLKVLTIGTDDDFLKKIYTDNGFIYKQSSLKALDFNRIHLQDLIILNRLSKITGPVIEILKDFIQKDKNLVIIPDENADLQSYNLLFKELGLGKILQKETQKRLITAISYDDPFFKNVFRKKIRNFQYPYVNISYKTHFKNGSKLLGFDNREDFIIKQTKGSSNIFWITSSLTPTNTNFLQSPLIIPVFYNFSLKNISNETLYLETGNAGRFEVIADPGGTEVLHLTGNGFDFIPRQEQSSDKVIIYTKEQPLKAGIYNVMLNDQTLKKIAYNYPTVESIPKYADMKKFVNNKNNMFYFNDLNKAFTNINEANKSKDLWQLFLIFALIFLIIEILLQRLL